jgi:hypothetical protein
MLPIPGAATPTLRDRILGCMLGGAIGDAWGGLYEGAPPPSASDFPPPRACPTTRSS